MSYDRNPPQALFLSHTHLGWVSVRVEVGDVAQTDVRINPTLCVWSDVTAPRCSRNVEGSLQKLCDCAVHEQDVDSSVIGDLFSCESGGADAVWLVVWRSPLVSRTRHCPDSYETSWALQSTFVWGDDEGAEKRRNSRIYSSIYPLRLIYLARLQACLWTVRENRPRQCYSADRACLMMRLSDVGNLAIMCFYETSGKHTWASI